VSFDDIEINPKELEFLGPGRRLRSTEAKISSKRNSIQFNGDIFQTNSSRSTTPNILESPKKGNLNRVKSLSPVKKVQTPSPSTQRKSLRKRSISPTFPSILSPKKESTNDNVSNSNLTNSKSDSITTTTHPTNVNNIESNQTNHINPIPLQSRHFQLTKEFLTLHPPTIQMKIQKQGKFAPGSIVWANRLLNDQKFYYAAQVVDPLSGEPPLTILKSELSKRNDPLYRLISFIEGENLEEDDIFIKNNHIEPVIGWSWQHEKDLLKLGDKLRDKEMMKGQPSLIKKRAEKSFEIAKKLAVKKKSGNKKLREAEERKKRKEEEMNMMAGLALMTEDKEKEQLES